ncbi:Uncharacterised protein [Megamonas hypermegale]|uniref:Zinc-ribbon domain-containing protein n=1 Tax=Megamonas hypermegale TaxID=158847 RepID=A0A378NPZ3_9FIRM|nr:zinc ribbon domain-containing protein [Megamonas hypermegale]STY70442.1 Uncharacterised protein [Megamonas hypermegale]
MYKFCTHCGAKMPNENAFCTNCGAKFSQIPTPQQNMAPTNINYNTSNSNTMPPYMHNQQTQQINNMPNPNNMQMASQEFAIGQQYMDINNPQHNYIKAINHFQKSSLLGNQNAKFYMAMAYLYQAMDILKQSAPLQNNPSFSTNNFSSQASLFPQNPNNHGNQNNDNNSTLKNVGKYAAAAAVGAMASSMLHSASTASAAPHTDTNINTPDPANTISPTIDSSDDYIQTPEEFVTNVVDPLSTASEQITPADISDDGTNHVDNLDNNSDSTAAQEIEPSTDEDISSDNSGDDSSISDTFSNLFDDLW